MGSQQLTPSHFIPIKHFFTNAYNSSSIRLFVFCSMLHPHTYKRVLHKVGACLLFIEVNISCSTFIPTCKKRVYLILLQYAFLFIFNIRISCHSRILWFRGIRELIQTWIQIIQKLSRGCKPFWWRLWTNRQAKEISCEPNSSSNEKSHFSELSTRNKTYNIRFEVLTS